MKTTVTRVAFCKKCFDKGYPVSGQFFLAFGTTTNDYVLRKARRHGKRGYTPHIIRILKVFDGNVWYEYLCSICGTKRRKLDEGTDEFYFLDEDFKQGIMKVRNWNSWIMYKNDEDYEI